MKCPDCETLDTIVFESLPRDFALGPDKMIPIVARRRRCRECKTTWTTVEVEAKARIKDNEVAEIIFKHFSIESGDGEGFEGLGPVYQAGNIRTP